MFLSLSINRTVVVAIVCGALLIAYHLPGEWVNRLSQNNLTIYVYSGLCICRTFEAHKQHLKNLELLSQSSE
jgi:hypothetical protein